MHIQASDYIKSEGTPQVERREIQNKIDWAVEFVQFNNLKELEQP